MAKQIGAKSGLEPDIPLFGHVDTSWPATSRTLVPVGGCALTTSLILLIGLVLDATFGEPKAIWSRLTHPAILMGRVINACDTAFNNGTRRRTKGLVIMICLCAATGLLGWVVTILPMGWMLEILILTALLAQRSLVDHVKAVADALRLSVPDGRMAVARIVGRDTDTLDTSGVARSAIESAAENLSDGVIAPAFWFLVAGLPGLLIYKITNTADSMIGYRTPKYEAFGWAAAKLDDGLNWIPARLTSGLILISALRLDGLSIASQDAKLHRSPNAGWPEAAMAVVLGVALAGPRAYDGEMRSFPFVHPKGRHTLASDDIDASIAVLWRSWALFLALILTVQIF